MKRTHKDNASTSNVESQQPSKKQKKHAVRFNEESEVREFDNDQDGVVKDSESGDLVGARIVGEKITSIEGEEDEDTWSDDDKQDIAIEPFNLKQEQEEGYFDVTGHYVENKFSKGVSDAWLDEYDEKWAKKMRGKQDTKAQQNLDQGEQPKVDKVALKTKLISFLNEGENALAALRRYSGKNKKDGDMAKFNELTDFYDNHLDIYSDSRERLLAEMKEDELAEQETQQSESVQKEETLWEYKLKDGTAFGPYTSRDMASWSQQGYFTAESGALVRQVKKSEENLFDDEEESENEFVPSHTVDFSNFIR